MLCALDVNLDSEPCNGTFVCASSDERIKQNIEPIASSTALAEIEQLQPVTFTYKDPTLARGTQLGFLAQQVQQLYPGLVSTTSATTTWTPDGTLSLNYTGLIAPLVAAVQDIADIGSTFEQNLIAWLGNAQNGIGEFFAQVGNFQTTNTQTLCITSGPNDPSPVCVTKTQLAALLSAQSTIGSSRFRDINPCVKLVAQQSRIRVINRPKFVA